MADKADLKAGLLGVTSPKRNVLASATMGNLEAGGSKKAIKRMWTCASPAEKQFQEVEVSAKDFTMEASAKIFTTQNVEMENKKIGKAMRKMTMVIDNLVSEAEGAYEEEAVVGLQTNGEATLNMLNQNLGSGMLGMGFAISQTGLLMGFLMMLCSLFLNRKTLFLNMKVSDYAGVEPASTEVGAVAFGKGGQFLLVVMVSLLGFFCMVSYIDASADAAKGLLVMVMEEDQIPSETNLAIICWACLLMPPTWIRSMNLVALFSFIAFLGSIGIVLSVSAVCITILAQEGLPSMGSINMFPQDLASFLNAVPIILLVFSVQAGGDVILATMKDSSQANKEKVTAFAQKIVLVMLYFVGALAYVTFGDKTQGDLLLNFPAKSFASILARMASLDLVVLSYMIMCIPCKVSIIDMVFGKNEAKQESSFLQYYGTVSVINVCALGFALAVRDLSLVLGIDGAVCTNFVALILPAAFWMKVQAKPADAQFKAVPVLSAANVPYFLILTTGIASMLLSSYQVLQRMQQG